MMSLSVYEDDRNTKKLFSENNYSLNNSPRNKTNGSNLTQDNTNEIKRTDNNEDISVAEYEKLCLSDQWVSDSLPLGDDQNHAVSGQTKTHRKKNSGSKKKKKRSDSHRQSVAPNEIMPVDTKTYKTPDKRKNIKNQTVLHEQTGKSTSEDSALENPSDTLCCEAEVGKKTAEARGFTGSKIQLPSLVFTAAGSALDEGLDKGQSFSHISYNMDGLKDSPTVKFDDSPPTIMASEYPGFDTAARRVHSISESLDDSNDSPIQKMTEPSFRLNANTDKNNDGEKYASLSNNKASSVEKNTSSERRGSKSKRSKRKKSLQCAQGMTGNNMHPEINKHEVPSYEFLQDPTQTQDPDSTTQKRRSLSDNPTVTFYFKVCKKLDVLPLRKVIQQFDRAHMTFKNLTLTSRDIKAVCLTLQRESFASSLDFTGNFIQAKELGYIISVLNRLHTIFQVSLCNNNLHSQGISDISKFLLTNDFLTRLDVSGNKLTDRDAPYVTAILQKNTTLKTLLLNHNEFREEGGILIGQALGENTTLEDIDLSWNHLRRRGAIGIATGLQQNTALRAVNLAWNGFGFEGCVAIGDMMCTNTTITELDLAYNRIGPQALLEVLRGVSGNKTLRILKMGHNPVTASFSSFILLVVQKHRECALENIDLAGVVVDKEFVALLEEIQKDRFFIVNYEVSLPVKKMSREEMREKIGLPAAYNVDPLRMLYLLKEKMRASDFFYKINKDNDDGLQRDELYELFEEAGLPVTTSVIDKIMEFMDTNGDGTIDLGEFLQGDKRIKSMSRKQLRDQQERRNKDGNFNKYSRTFQKANVDPLSLALKEPSNTPAVRQSNRRMSSSKHDSDNDDNNHLKIP